MHQPCQEDSLRVRLRAETCNVEVVAPGPIIPWGKWRWRACTKGLRCKAVHYKMLSINKGQDGRPGREADESNARGKGSLGIRHGRPECHPKCPWDALSTRHTSSSPLSHKERNLNLIEKHNLRGWEVNGKTSNFKVCFLRSCKVQKLYKSEELFDTLSLTEKKEDALDFVIFLSTHIVLAISC